ncbi:MAG: 1-acyl-sn-glycerol-3-phosphate acyltransferase [Alphaproteobacteria bacterium]
MAENNNHRKPMHIVDELIEERCPRLATLPAWPLVRPLLYAALNYNAARSMADAIAPLSGQAALAYVSNLLHLKLELIGIDRMPTKGRCVVVANHPTGIADGLAVRDMLRRVRQDEIFFANADALRVCPGFADTLIPVEWVPEKRTLEKTKRTLRAVNAAFAAERAVVIFPAGRLPRWVNGKIQELEWEPSAVSLARKHDAPLIPLHVAGPYPIFFHTFSRFSKELSDITLFHELLNKAGQTYRITIGQPIAPDQLAGGDAQASARLKVFCEKKLGANPDAEFTPEASDV